MQQHLSWTTKRHKKQKLGLHTKNRIEWYFLACDSRRKHKAWGASPRLTCQIKRPESATAADRLEVSRCRPFHGLRLVFCDLILGLAPQALCLRLLRRLRKAFDFGIFCKAQTPLPLSPTRSSGMLLTKAGKVIAWWFLGNTFNLVFATGF